MSGRRLLIAAAIVVWSVGSWSAQLAHAQELGNIPVRLTVALADVPVQPPAAVEQPAFAMPRLATPTAHINLLLPLYVSTAVFQALDVHSTFAVLSHGGAEVNPMLSGLVSNRPAFIAVKAGIAAGTIYAASRIARHNKVAAIAALIGLNSMYAMVVSHNYQVAHSIR
jgi:hypothetical protein